MTSAKTKLRHIEERLDIRPTQMVPAVNKSTGEVTMKPDGKTPAKIPVEMSSPKNPTICFGGLWSRATFKDEDIETCAIVTRAAIAPLDKLHDRMPACVLA